MKNIMEILTPTPPFNPSKKNQAVKFGKAAKGVNAIKQKTVMTKGINRTKN